MDTDAAVAHSLRPWLLLNFCAHAATALSAPAGSTLTALLVGAMSAPSTAETSVMSECSLYPLPASTLSCGLAAVPPTQSSPLRAGPVLTSAPIQDEEMEEAAGISTMSACQQLSAQRTRELRDGAWTEARATADAMMVLLGKRTESHRKAVTSLDHRALEIRAALEGEILFSLSDSLQYIFCFVLIPIFVTLFS